MATFINKIEDKATALGIERNTKKSLKWFQKEIANIKMPSRPKLLKDENFEERNNPFLGKMFMYFYDPKHKKTLPYYDRFPLIFLVEKTKDGFYGLNLHYLPPRERALFFDKLTDFKNNDKYNKVTRLKLTYDLLKSTSGLRYFAPCFKRYLTSHVKSKIVEVPSMHWETVLFLPSQQFMKSKDTTVWQQSKKQYR